MDAETLLTKKLRRVPNVIVRKEENCYLLVNRNVGKVLVINDVGFRIWHLLPKLTIKTIIDKIAEEYEVDVTLGEKEVLKFAKKILENNFATL